MIQKSVSEKYYGETFVYTSLSKNLYFSLHIFAILLTYIIFLYVYACAHENIVNKF